MGLFDFAKRIKLPSGDIELDDDYVELDADVGESSAKVLIRTFAMERFDDIKPILAAIREGHTIALVNIAAIKDKDPTDLKRAVDKLKKTIDANDGDVAGFGESWLIATPSFARVYKGDSKRKLEVVEEDFE